MAKFASIWGDLEVNESSITPAPENWEEKNKDASSLSSLKNTEEEDTTTNVDNGEDLPTSTKQEKVKVPESKENTSEEEYEFTEGDVSKAYTILLEEGILESTEDEEFEASPKGLADAVASTIRKKVAEELSKRVISTEDEDEEEDWTETEMNSDEDKERVIKAYHTLIGLDEEDSEEELAVAISSGKLDRKAEVALAALQKNYTTNASQKVEARKLEEQRIEQAQRKEIDNIHKMIDSAQEIAGFKLDEEKRKKFKAYLFDINPRTGKTQLQENMSNEERRMTIAFLDYVNYTKADLEKHVADTLTKERKKKLMRYTDTNIKNANGSAVIKTKTNAAKGSIVFPSIFGQQKIVIED